MMQVCFFLYLHVSRAMLKNATNFLKFPVTQGKKKLHKEAELQLVNLILV